MDHSDGYETPGRQAEDKQQGRTAGGTESRFQGMVQSKYELNEGQQQSENNNNRNQELDEIEAEIKKIEERLREIHSELHMESDKTSEKALNLEQQRATLRKRIIDLDYEHKTIISKNIRESRRREQQEKQRLIKEAQEERERRQQQIEQRLQKQKQERDQRIQEINQKLEKQRQQRQKLQQQGEKVEGQEQQKTQKKQGEGLDQSRRRLRIAQIEAELAQSRLRRSRQAALSAQLDYIRSSYLHPYPYLWRDYYYRPYSYYSSLYPYYYSPYTYLSSYTSPYRLWY